ncbi:uncharacterized protein LOC114366161 [Ostrinia furnacalis]|uniref:uncharacterized protein LOC114366161 n=1 Tax=Ostrinia furnacalis TaxID=93504 RepID=UPI001039AE6E|nr:uncharacterized protein LOC114366161 [Ostrinia furnacalis]
MESILQPPQPFIFENDITNVTSGNLSKDWEKWKNAFKIYFEACELQKKDNKVQINILLHIIGEKCREVYEQFKGDIKTIEDLLKEFDRFFLPRKNITIERHAFFTRNQRELESVEQYVFELNKIAAKCEFEQLKSELVRDRMICGIRDGALRERLLRETELTLSKAVDICTLAEISRLQANSIKTDTQMHHVDEIVSDQRQDETCVHFVRRGGPRNSPAATHRTSKWRQPARRRDSGSGSAQTQVSTHNQQTVRRKNVFSNNYEQSTSKGNKNIMCRKCGINHNKFNCPAFGQRCIACNKMNHYARMCQVYEVQEESSDQVIYTINNNSSNNDWSVVLLIKNTPINFKLDTGADVNILPKTYLKDLNILDRELARTTLKLQGYAGSKIEVLGKCFLKVIYKQNVYILRFIVVNTQSPPILGRSSCAEMNLIQRVMAVKHITNTSVNILDKFPDLFSGIGCLPGTYKIELKEDAQPVVHAPRKLPVALKEQVRNKLL